jgi:hypothetical protein
LTTPSQASAECIASSHQTPVYATKGKHSLNTSLVLMFGAGSAVPARTLAQNLLVSSCSSICTPSASAALHLVALLQHEDGGEGALRRAAYVLVRRVVVAPVGRAPEALDVLGVDKAQPRLAVRAADLREGAVRARGEALPDVLLGGGDVPVGPLLEDALARLLEDAPQHGEGAVSWGAVVQEARREELAEPDVRLEIVLVQGREVPGQHERHGQNVRRVHGVAFQL